MIVLHTVSRSTKELRSWPYWSELADRLILDGEVVAFSGSHQDLTDIKLATRGIKATSGWYIHTTENLREFSDLLRFTRLFVTVNTGVMHLAVALKCPTFAIIGGTPASVVAHPSKIFRYVEDPGLKDYPNFKSKMEEITCARVYWAIKEMLDEKDAVSA